MKIPIVFIILLSLLSGCRSMPFDTHTVIDWVDFIKWEGREYNGIYTGILADEKFLGEKAGEVKFRVADNVTNPNYKIQNGDAAFHEKGTEIYAIKGQPDLIAVKNPDEINGYSVYYSVENEEFNWHFDDMPAERVERIEIYRLYTQKGDKKILELKQEDDLSHFLQLLKDSKNQPGFNPNTAKGDPIFYNMIFYTGEPVAYKFNMQFDGTVYYWHPWETAILPDAIKDFILEP
ncbi:hypothetical protein J7I93_20680 [Bacillus sp. ISL-47]|uniref:hypothetical protein n=1 Tax=Bacillus sp. ISL-47 TaxID=2819130 RepID=UPI001BEA4E99|nr:hypothetical protein [Bacillus sp. ISL-47]MBT2690576.1 hypothetical protein [Bacillus sp. ISL-47]MBT2708170.1 hypothetical protein [Pseudomonas sp. ISL-84]